jgi:hypothetical protein
VWTFNPFIQLFSLRKKPKKCNKDVAIVLEIFSEYNGKTKYLVKIERVNGVNFGDATYPATLAAAGYVGPFVLIETADKIRIN